jgi:Spy/CpxP family protein refolding chaperone
MGMMGGPMGGEFDPSRAEARIERMAKHLAVEADASPAQQEKLVAIAKAAAKDMVVARTAMREQRQRTMALLTSPNIDRAQLEAARADQMKRADEMSKRVTQAVVEAAEVLTPEQRKKLAEHIGERRRFGPLGMGAMWGPSAS